MLKKRIAKLEDVPEALRTEYKKDGDEYVLDVDGQNDSDEVRDLRKRLNEFRDNNLTLTRQKEQLETRMEQYKDVDPAKWEEAKRALDTINAIQEKDLIKDGKFDTVIENRLSGAKKKWDEEKQSFTRQLEAKDKDLGKYKGSYKRLRIEAEINRTIPLIAQPKPGAIPDIMQRAYQVWDIDDKEDKLVAKDFIDDETGKSGTLEQWGKELVKTAGHLFESGGGGGAGGGKKDTGKGPNGSQIKTIKSSDIVGVGRHAKEIAAGTIKVVDDSGDSGDDL